MKNNINSNILENLKYIHKLIKNLRLYIIYYNKYNNGKC